MTAQTKNNPVRAPARKSTVAGKSTAPDKSTLPSSAKRGSAAGKAASASKLPLLLPPPVVAKAKAKLVRDSFTIPKAEYTVLEGLKNRATHLRHPTKKSEVIRAGIAALHVMTDTAFLAALGAVASLKTGRPKQDEKGG